MNNFNTVANRVSGVGKLRDKRIIIPKSMWSDYLQEYEYYFMKISVFSDFVKIHFLIGNNVNENMQIEVYSTHLIISSEIPAKHGISWQIKEGKYNDKSIIHLPRQVRCEIWQNAMKWGVSWHSVARGKRITTGWTTKVDDK